MLVVETHGTAYERGRQYGTQLAAHLRRRAPARPLHPGGRSEADAIAGRMLAYLERHEPALVEELRGLAAGAEMRFDEVFHFNVSSFVRYIQDFPGDGAAAAPAAGAAADGCTNVAFTTTEHGPLLGKTNDGGAPVPPERQPTTWVLQHARPDTGPAFFMLAPVGALAGVAGLNDGGFAVGQSAAQVVPGQRGFGVPSNLILRPLLERCATVAAALDLLAARDLAGKGLNLMLLDAAGTLRAAEMSGDMLGVRSPDAAGTLYFSNHCHTPGLRDLPPRHDRDNSLRRWAYLENHVGGATGAAEHTWDGMRAVINSHGEPTGWDSHPGAPVVPSAPSASGGAGAICQHGPDMFTSLGLIIAPRERTLWTADGTPCAAPFVERRLTPN
jgi:hypothetical protein